MKHPSNVVICILYAVDLICIHNFHFLVETLIFSEFVILLSNCDK